MIRNVYSIIGYTQKSNNDKDQNIWRIYFLLNEIRYSDNTQACAVFMAPPSWPWRLGDEIRRFRLHNKKEVMWHSLRLTPQGARPANKKCLIIVSKTRQFRGCCGYWSVHFGITYTCTVYTTTYVRGFVVFYCALAITQGLLDGFVKLRIAHAPWMPGTFSPPPRVGDPGMHHGTAIVFFRAVWLTMWQLQSCPNATEPTLKNISKIYCCMSGHI